MVSRIKHFFLHEAAGGMFLFIAAILALIFQNSPLRDLYTSFLSTPIEIRIGEFSIAKATYVWINDFLMAIFFLLVGLEVKREFKEGELSSLKKVSLPGFAAIGGMALPALGYYLVNHANPQYLHGWAIPTATDIAFSLGLLMTLGSRVPTSLKIFLTTLAIFDDLGAIIVIAIFYTHDLSEFNLAMAAVFCLVLFIMNRKKITSLAPYIIVGLILWVCVLKSGIHATLAGVVVAFAIPMRDKKTNKSPLVNLEHALHPWVSFLILPIFAFANGGLDLHLLSIESLSNPIAFGIIVGLFFGKQLGVFGFSWLAIKLKIASLPRGVSYLQLYGISVITGLGFTMSLFISSLAFDDPAMVESAKAGTIVGSVLSGILAYMILYLSSPQKQTKKQSRSKSV